MKQKDEKKKKEENKTHQRKRDGAGEGNAEPVPVSFVSCLLFYHFLWIKSTAEVSEWVCVWVEFRKNSGSGENRMYTL